MYTDHYGLSAAPFQLTPDPRFWFETATHKKAMAYLGYGLAQGEGFITVTGEVGAGKTTLVGHLLETLDPLRVDAIAIMSTQVDGDDMLRLIAHRMEIASEDVEKAQLLDKIAVHLDTTARSGRRTLIIVDEAQNLTHSALEELRMLSNNHDGGRPLVQFLLLGQPEFRARLVEGGELEQLRQRIIASHHLDGMGAGEVRPYLEHRLRLVGWSGKPSFGDVACEKLHAASAGIPRRLNGLATRALLAAAMDNLGVIDGHVVDNVIADQSNDETPMPAQSATPLAAAAASVAANRGTESSIDHEARIAMLEAQIREQEVALRRVLTLMVDFIERDDKASRRGTAA